MKEPTKGKVYFVAALIAKNEYGKYWQKIADTFRDLGYEVWDDVNNISADEARQYSKEQITDYFKEVQKRIKDADIFVAEESHSSSSIGYEIGYAMGNNKPCLVLRMDHLSPSGAPLRGNPSKLLSYVNYNPQNLERRIKQFEKKARKGIFVKRLPIEFTQNQVEYVMYRQTAGPKKKSFNSAVREIIDKARYHDAEFDQD